MTVKPIDAAIDAAEAKIRDLTHDLRQQKRALKKLYEARALAAGEEPDDESRRRAKPLPLPDLVERLLREHGDMHVGEIVEALRVNGTETNRQTLSSMFVRYIARGKRFQRVGANKFALRTEE